MATESLTRLPPWFKVRFPGGEHYESFVRIKGLLRQHKLHTICEEAHCPNIGECYGHGTATFLILGDICTRACRYCAVKRGRPGAVNYSEPDHLAKTVQALGLKHVVITSVNRDDLEDGGAHVFALCITKIRERCPGIAIEVLIPDFLGSREALAKVVAARPEILNHNIETVARIFPKVRAKGRYQRSLELLARAKEMAPSMLTKSGMMVGLGETQEEIVETMRDLRAVQCDIVTLGQYLRPSKQHVPVSRFYTPLEFRELAALGKGLGFRHVESGPLVRSSYHAHEQVAVA